MAFRIDWLKSRTGGLVLVGFGLVVGFAGVLMAWDARLHNAIVANQVENPWPGYLVAALGVALVATGIATVVRNRRMER